MTRHPDLEDAVDALLAASRALIAVSARSIADLSVTLPQFRMLVTLQVGPRNLSRLAAALDVAPSTAMRMVDRLESAGLVTRQTDPTDRRVSQLALTPVGVRVVRTVTQRRRRDLLAVLEHVPIAHRRSVVTAMDAFAMAAARTWPGDFSRDDTETGR